MNTKDDVPVDSSLTRKASRLRDRTWAKVLIGLFSGAAIPLVATFVVVSWYKAKVINLADYFDGLGVLSIGLWYCTPSSALLGAWLGFRSARKRTNLELGKDPQNSQASRG